MTAFFNWIKRFYKFFEDMFYDIMYDNKAGLGAPMTFSVGRASFVTWFTVTIQKALASQTMDYLWYVLGISLLSYVIGKQYIITNLGVGVKGLDTEEHP